MRRAATIDSYTGEDLARAVVQVRHPAFPVRPVVDRVPDLGSVPVRSKRRADGVAVDLCFPHGQILAISNIITTGRAVRARPATAVGLFRLLVAPLRAEVIGCEVCPSRRFFVAGRADPLLDELCDSCVRRRALAACRRRATVWFGAARRAGRGLEAEAVFIYLVDAPV